MGEPLFLSITVPAIFICALANEIKKSSFELWCGLNDTRHMSVILGNNGKIIEPETLPINIPEVTGTNDMKKIFQTIEIIKKSDFDIRKIRKINFFPSKRIDIELGNKKKIKFPINLKIDDLNFGFRVINDEKFNQVKIVDLRIPNKVITDD